MKKYKIGYTQGTFDMFNVNHLNLLKHAAEQCERLIVGVSSDKLVESYKHKAPIINESDRRQIVASIKCVDEAIVVNTLDKQSIAKDLPFDTVFIGSDWKEDTPALPQTEEISNTLRDGLPNETVGAGNHNTLGYTTGVFDMFHVGHLNVINRAAEQCDYLIVGVSSDELVERDKHKTPIVALADRMAIVAEIKGVDKVVVQHDKNKLGAWENYHFNRMFVGSDWQGTPQWQTFEQQFAPLGVEIVYLPHTDGISSTILREKLK